MELVQMRVPRSSSAVVIAPIGDIQWSGDNGSTARDHLRRHVERCLALDAWFIGMGDYIDFASPSNRARLAAANVYDTAQEVLEGAATNLVDELVERFLKPTIGRWIGLLEGHHFYEFGGRTSDMILAEKLKTRALGTSCYVNVQPGDVTLWAHHGTGGGILPTSGINKLYHTSAGLQGADAYLMGHNTKLGSMRLSRPFPCWDRNEPNLSHRDVLLVNTGGFSRSNVPRSRRGSIPRGDYAEQGMMTPSPLSAPVLRIYLREKRQEDRVRAEI